MKWIFIIVLQFLSITIYAQHTLQKYVDSLEKEIPEPSIILEGRNIEVGKMIVRKYPDLLDSILHDIESGLYTNSFDFTYENKKYTNHNFLDFIELRLMKPNDTIHLPPPTEFVTDNLLSMLPKRFYAKLHELDTIRFSCRDTTSFRRANRIWSDLYIKTDSMIKVDEFTASILYLNMIEKELCIKDAMRYINDTSIATYKECNIYLNSLIVTFGQKMASIKDTQKQMIYCLFVADLYYRYDKYQESMLFLIQYFSYDKYSNQQWVREMAYRLLYKLSLTSNNFLNNYAVEKFVDHDDSNLADNVNIYNFFDPLFIKIKQDRFKNHPVSSTLIDTLLYDQVSFIKIKLSHINTFLLGDSTNETQLLTLSTIIKGRPFKIDNRDTLNYDVFKNFQLLNSVLNIGFISDQRLWELLDDYFVARLERNEFEKANNFFTEVVKKNKSLRNTPKIFNYLFTEKSQQKLYGADSTNFLHFKDSYFKFLFDTSIVKSNEKYLLSNFDSYMEAYFLNKPAWTEGEWKKNQDSITYYGYWSYKQSPNISFGQIEGIGLVSSIYSEEIQKIEKKKDSVTKEYTHIKNEYKSQLDLNRVLDNTNRLLSKKNISLKDSNSRLSDHVAHMDSILTQMQKDTLNLGKTVRALQLDTAKLKENIDSLNTDVKNKGGEIVGLNNDIWFRTILSFVLPAVTFILMSIPLYKRRDKINALNLEKDKLSVVVANMNSQIESEKIAHEQELNSSNSKILNEYAVKHEIVGILSGIYSFYENKVSEVPKFKIEQFSFLTILKDKLFKLKSFAHTYYSTLQSDVFNSIDEEINLSKEYVEFIKLKSNIHNVILRDVRKHINVNIVVPNHIINNLIKNSIEKGMKDNNVLEIRIDDEAEGNTYKLKIIDNGKGIGNNFVIEKLPKESTGIRSIMKQIEYYNSRLDLPYSIELGNDSFVDRINKEDCSGTVVTILFKMKTYEN